MNKHLFLLMAICLCFPAAIQIAAQTPAPAAPHAVLQILREEIKAGRSAAHEKLETGYVRAFEKANWPVHWLGMTAVSGLNEAWYLIPYDSFAALEKDRQSIEKAPALLRELEQLDQQDSEYRTGQRTLMAVFRKELSYRPDQVAGSAPKSRYFNVLTVRVRPGRDLEFVQAVRMYLAAIEKAKLDVASATYQVISGAPGGTYLVFSTMKSLEEMDAGPARERAILEALGAENGQKVLKAISETVLTAENTLFAFSPKMSYVSKEFAAADPEFWKPKPKVAARPAAAPKKQMDKAGANQ